MKTIILAGGQGTRLYPMTTVISKQLLPVYDKPMIYYPLSVPLLMGLRDILLISTPQALPLYQQLLGDGSRLGVNIQYAAQEKPQGLAQSLLIGESFAGGDEICLILGDNVFYGHNLTSVLADARSGLEGASIFGYPVKDPQSYGVVEFDAQNRVLSLEEKPEHPKSSYAVPGLYFYDNRAVEIAKHIRPSARGELEITAVNQEYLRQGQLKVTLFGRGIAWLDTGTPEGMLKASEYVEAVQSRQGFYISCIEEIAWRRGFIDSEQLCRLGQEAKSTDYGKYILSLVGGCV
ncbi:MAG: glucose-1-phosphate thymidylyltransferase RfbA [Oscillibacter sp.]|jgi:glucose-1-phosphate thymidylyltransferase|nr:glucose-1-phosphate thymidylyltransferase RfbA [Oscillibacter sp.]MCI8849891.1 glucose-1-phosphate thymidylyltransferase RfbA [Oscillibacter sp.]MCI9376905.1 glucose-1-phosphate thymidylyltransferase RfbA [Oscillibacter sp.]